MIAVRPPLREVGLLLLRAELTGNRKNPSQEVAAFLTTPSGETRNGLDLDFE
jgi:hypothetical protein